MNILLFSLLFFLPAGIANMAPVVAAKIPGLSRLDMPMDFGFSFRGKRVFGDHKTVRGILVGIISGIVTAAVLSFFVPSLYKNVNPILVGFLLAFGALAGDSVKSFFKRQVGIVSGKSWFPFDQIDYIVGGLLCSLLALQLSLIDYVVIFFLYFLLHLVTAYLGFVLHFKESAI